jgi:type IV secretory pathway VirJ component
MIRPCLILLALALATPSRAEETTHLQPQQTLVPSGEMRGLVLLFSDHGGIDDQDRAAAKALVDAGSLVAEIDSDSYLASFAAELGTCDFLVPDIEALSRQLQRVHPGVTYHAPILAGRGLGGTLAEAGLAQAYPATVAGAASLDPAESAGATKPFCGDPLAVHKSLQGFWVAGFSAPGARRDRVAALQASGTPVTIEDARTLDALVLPHLPPPSAEIDALPLVELPAEHPSDLLAVVLSGDGGWRDIDSSLAEALRQSGVSVVGWDSLRYFWNEKTPNQTAEDLAAVLQIYMAKWQASRVALIGYSFGADILPFAYDRLPADLQGHVVQISLLGFADRADFEISMTGWLGAPPSDKALPVTPEIARVPAGMLQCFHGSEESDNACAILPKGVEQIELPGGHHFDGAYDELARRILAGLQRRSGR